MPRDGGGTYTLPAGNPVIPGTIIESTWANPTMNDIAAALTDSLSRTGSGGMIVPFLNADGSVALPGISWANQQNMGFWRPGLDEMRVSVAGNDKARWTSDALNPMDIFVGGMWVAVMNEGGDYSPTGTWDWSGATITSYGNPIVLSDADPRIRWQETGATADEGNWLVRANNDQFRIQTATDAAPDVAVEAALRIERNGSAVGPWSFRGNQYDFERAGGGDIFRVLLDGTDVFLRALNSSLCLDAVSNSVDLFHNGTLRALTAQDGTFRVLSDGSSDTEKRMVQLEASSGAIRGEWGWTATEAFMHLENKVNGQNTDLQGRALGGNLRKYLIHDPDGITLLRGLTDLSLQVADGEVAFYGTANGKSAMYFNNLEMARTLAAASGGLEANNTATGVGFERVLTVSDLGGGGSTVKGGKFFNTIAQSILDNVETRVNFASEAYDTDGYHVGGTPSRITIPAGGARQVRLTGQIVFPPNGSSFRRLEVRRNGINNGRIDDDMTTMFTQVYASAANASIPNLGMSFDTGIIATDTADYFEVFVYHNAGVSLSLISQQQWFQIEDFG